MRAPCGRGLRPGAWPVTRARDGLHSFAINREAIVVVNFFTVPTATFRSRPGMGLPKHLVDYCKVI